MTKERIEMIRLSVIGGTCHAITKDMALNECLVEIERQHQIIGKMAIALDKSFYALRGQDYEEASEALEAIRAAKEKALE